MVETEILKCLTTLRTYIEKHRNQLAEKIYSEAKTGIEPVNRYMQDEAQRHLDDLLNSLTTLSELIKRGKRKKSGAP